MKKNIYVSTPIFYPSGRLHIGHAYTTVVADIIARYHRLRGNEVFFVTGMDEHGQKIADKAKVSGTDPQTYVDQLYSDFVTLWSALDISYDRFIRTTEGTHKRAVQAVFSEFLERGLIYKGQWNGLYCVSCEENYTSNEAKHEHGHLLCRLGHELEERLEDSYFLRVTAQRTWLNELMQHGELAFPESAAAEMTGSFLTEDFSDLAITRKNLEWGIKVKEDSSHTIYVWFDALLNYITALGYKTGEGEGLFNKFWINGTKIQLIGKEIARFHLIYWPAILHGLNLPLPTKVMVHGWLTDNDRKISKSLGNFSDISTLIKLVGTEGVRCYLAAKMSWGGDTPYSEQLVVEEYNTFLANNFGNLASRLTGMLVKYANCKTVSRSVTSLTAPLYNELQLQWDKYMASMDASRIENGYEVIKSLMSWLNKYIEETKPWQLAKNNAMELETFFSGLIDAIHLVVTMAEPFIPKSASALRHHFHFAVLQEKEIEQLIKGNLGRVETEIAAKALIMFERITLTKPSK